MPSFAVSIAALSLLQAVLVALPRHRLAPGWLPSSPWWALVPAGSIAVVVGGIELLPDSAEALTWLALIAVPPLAAAALGWLVRGGRRAWALAVIPLFAIAWSAQGALAGETAAALLSALACISLGWLLVVAVPGAWLRWGIYGMAALDAVLVTASILQGPSDVLSAAAPGAELPRLQVLEFGAARMGFGDAFVAATVGCLLAASRRRLEAALLVAVIGLAFDLLFFTVDTLPATVPVAISLALVEWRGRRDGDPAAP